eukprot:10418505-Ditylum_brightwellii.AAC.1
MTALVGSDGGIKLGPNDGTTFVGLDDSKSMKVGLGDGKKVSAKNESINKDVELGFELDADAHTIDYANPLCPSVLFSTLCSSLPKTTAAVAFSNVNAAGKQGQTSIHPPLPWDEY